LRQKQLERIAKGDETLRRVGRKRARSHKTKGKNLK